MVNCKYIWLACVRRDHKQTQMYSCLFDSGPDCGVFHRLAIVPAAFLRWPDFFEILHL